MDELAEYDNKLCFTKYAPLMPTKTPPLTAIEMLKGYVQLFRKDFFKDFNIPYGRRNYEFNLGLYNVKFSNNDRGTDQVNTKLITWIGKKSEHVARVGGSANIKFMDYKSLMKCINSPFTVEHSILLEMINDKLSCHEKLLVHGAGLFFLEPPKSLEDVVQRPEFIFFSTLSIMVLGDFRITQEVRDSLQLLKLDSLIQDNNDYTAYKFDATCCKWNIKPEFKKAFLTCAEKLPFEVELLRKLYQFSDHDKMEHFVPCMKWFDDFCTDQQTCSWPPRAIGRLVMKKAKSDESEKKTHRPKKPAQKRRNNEVISDEEESAAKKLRIEEESDEESLPTADAAEHKSSSKEYQPDTVVKQKLSAQTLEEESDDNVVQVVTQSQEYENRHDTEETVEETHIAVDTSEKEKSLDTLENTVDLHQEDNNLTGDDKTNQDDFNNAISKDQEQVNAISKDQEQVHDDLQKLAVSSSNRVLYLELTLVRDAMATRVLEEQFIAYQKVLSNDAVARMKEFFIPENARTKEELDHATTTEELLKVLHRCQLITKTSEEEKVLKVSLKMGKYADNLKAFVRKVKEKEKTCSEDEFVEIGKRYDADAACAATFQKPKKAQNTLFQNLKSYFCPSNLITKEKFDQAETTEEILRILYNCKYSTS